ncbi:MAG: aminomethyl-transferring glycine dehydrogenase subunit GcvPB, partial [Candidatus Bathyarchaeia archaeon]
MVYAQAKWDEPLIIKLSQPGKIGFHQLSSTNEGDAALRSIPSRIRRAAPPALPEVTEIEVIRHFTRLSQENFGVDLGIYPLGSCTMKYNPKLCD